MLDPNENTHEDHPDPDARRPEDDALALPADDAEAVELLGRGGRARRRVRSAQPDDGQPGPAVGDDDRVRSSSRRGARIRANKYAAYFPATNPSNRQASVYDPKTGKFELIYTCFGTHHLQFSEQAGHAVLQRRRPDDSLGQRQDLGGDEERRGRPPAGARPCSTRTATARSPSRGTSRSAAAAAQNEGGGGGTLGKFDPKLDTRVNAGSYGIIVSPTDDSVWSAGTSYPGPVRAARTGQQSARDLQGRDLHHPGRQEHDRTSVRAASTSIATASAWAALSGSGGFASFDRRKCKVFNGPSVRRRQAVRRRDGPSIR